MKKAATKRKSKEFQTPYTVTGALVKGNAITKLSMLIMGLGNIAHKQIVKRSYVLAIEVAYLLLHDFLWILCSFHAAITWMERAGKRYGMMQRVFMNIRLVIIHSLSYFMELQHYILPSYLSLYGGKQ